MGRKKKKPVKPWCWYCNREFDDDKILIQHQRAKHFKCPFCHKKLYSGPGLTVHCIQVHKENLVKVPEALPNRNSVDIDIYGMQGIPEDDVREHERLKRGIPDAPSKAETSRTTSQSSKNQPTQAHATPTIAPIFPPSMGTGIMPPPVFPMMPPNIAMMPNLGMPPGFLPPPGFSLPNNLPMPPNFTMPPGFPMSGMPPGIPPGVNMHGFMMPPGFAPLAMQPELLAPQPPAPPPPPQEPPPPPDVPPPPPSPPHPQSAPQSTTQNLISKPDSSTATRPPPAAATGSSGSSHMSSQKVKIMHPDEDLSLEELRLRLRKYRNLPGLRTSTSSVA